MRPPRRRPASDATSECSSRARPDLGGTRARCPANESGAPKGSAHCRRGSAGLLVASVSVETVEVRHLHAGAEAVGGIGLEGQDAERSVSRERTALDRALHDDEGAEGLCRVRDLGHLALPPRHLREAGARARAAGEVTLPLRLDRGRVGGAVARLTVVELAGELVDDALRRLAETLAEHGHAGDVAAGPARDSG